MSLVRVLGRVPKSLLVSGGFLFVGLLLWADYATGPELSPLIFYAVPVVVVVWFAGRAAAVALSVFAAFAWFLADLLSRAYSHPAIPYWNGVEKLIFFLLLTGLISTLKTALEREKLARQEFLEREIQIARQVQERLFPQLSPELETLECTGMCRPVRTVGGDYYDILPLGEDRVGIAVGDVSGKGLSAALLMATVQATLRSFASVRGDAADLVVSDTNRQLCALTEPNRFVTLFWAVYDGARRELTYVNAGHNAPMLFRAGQSDGPERLSSGNTVLGLFPGASWSARAIALRSGDLLVLFTDGIPEASNARGEEFGEARLTAVVQANRDLPAPALCERILSAVSEFLGSEPAQDDLTVLVARELPRPR